MAAVRRISLFRREIRESVSPAAMEVLFASASRISEGQVGQDGRYYGSTVLTIDLEQLAPHVSDPSSVSTATRLARVLEAEPEVQQQAGRMALEEAARIAGARLRRAEVDVRVRFEGTRVFIDIDVEAAAPMPVPVRG